MTKDHATLAIGRRDYADRGVPDAASRTARAAS
jgi:hypothetical protein